MRQQSQPSPTEPRSTQMRKLRELDACGIGFVADAHGRPSRQIVTAALRGLANVKHRGAVAADARTSDGTGLLTTIPRRHLRRGRRRRRPVRPGRRPHRRGRGRRAAEGLEVVEWRTPPTDESALGELAAGSRPGIVQALIRPTADARAEIDRLVASGAEARLGDVGSEDLERRAYRLRRRIDATTEGTYVVSCSFRTIVYKGLVAADAPGRLLPRPRRRALRGPPRRLPPALQHQHAADLGAGPAVPPALPQRRDQHHRRQREPHARPRPARHRRGRPRPRGAVPPRHRPRRQRLGHARRGRRAAHARRAPPQPRDGHARARGVGGDPRPRPRGARLLRVPLRPHGAVGRPRRRDLHRRRRASAPRSTATACDRCATPSARTASSCAPPRWARSTSAATAPSTAAGSVPATCSSSSPSFGAVRNTAVKEHLAAEAPYAQWAADGFVHVPPGEPVADPPATCSCARPPTASPRRSWPWCSSPWPPTPTSPPSPWATTRRCRRWPAAPGRWPTTCASASPRSPTRRSTRCASGW